MDVFAAGWAYERGQPAGAGTDTLAGNDYLFLPLKAPMRTRGVLAIRPERTRHLLIPEQRRHYEAFAALTAIALAKVIPPPAVVPAIANSSSSQTISVEPPPMSNTIA